MIERILKTIFWHRMFQSGQRVGIAVSGGADSVCLLHVMREIAPRWDLRVIVIHLDHQLRGDDSRGDAEFVRRLAAALEVPFEIRQVDIAAICRESGDNLEQTARRARLEFFHGLLASSAVDRVATAHTRSDQAETVLFRILRGAGGAGLSGIRPVTAEGIVRPLLDIERPEIEAWLRERNIAWREDATNRNIEFARNRIRHALLPQLTDEWNPALVATLAHMADWAQAEEAYWSGEMARLESSYLTIEGSAVLLRVDSLADLSLAAARRLLRRALEITKGDLRGIGYDHLSAVLEMVAASDGHGRMQLPGLDVYRSFEWLRIAPPGFDNLANRNYRMPLPVPGSVHIPGERLVLTTDLFENTYVTESTADVYNGCVSGLDWTRISGSLEVRNWRPGDQYQPVGRGGPEKIKLLFQEARIPLWERRHWPIITQGDVIVWAHRFGPAAGFEAGTGSGRVLGIQVSRS